MIKPEIDKRSSKLPSKLPYGSWPSPLSAEGAAGASVRLRELRRDETDWYWLEGRPAEGGRQVVVQRQLLHPVDRTPPPFNARTRVHEYGGGSYTIAGSKIYFSHFEDGRVYCQAEGLEPVPLTPPGFWRYGDLTYDGTRRRLLAVCEDHNNDGEPQNRLIAIASDVREPNMVLASGEDFYASPRLSPDGKGLAWISWNHPNMPWDGTDLWIAELDAFGVPKSRTQVAGGPAESIYCPQWSPDGHLYFVSDRTGWWNLYVYRDGVTKPLLPMAAEFGIPQWVLGSSTYAFLSASRLICTYLQNGSGKLGLLDTESGSWQPLDSPYTQHDSLVAYGGIAGFIGSGPTCLPEVVQWDGEFKTLHRSGSLALDPADISQPETLEFPTEGGLTAFAFYYPPRHHAAAGLDNEKPPLLVISHGGPTGAAAAVLDPAVQFWTTRGFGVLDVNYGGSTGFGRAYRERLYGQWGVVDVDDCVNGAKFLVGRGLVDRNRCIIRGASAGGYTTLCALAFRDFFRAGASYYGVSDIEALQGDTHKFESHCDASLIGPYPEARQLFRDRSPIHAVDRLNCPVIFFQGQDDKVVPPNQAECMVEALRSKGMAVAYLSFPGEGHGFRKAANIRRCLEAEWYFYARVFGIPLPPAKKRDNPPVTIENL